MSPDLAPTLVPMLLIASLAAFALALLSAVAGFGGGVLLRTGRAQQAAHASTASAALTLLRSGGPPPAPALPVSSAACPRAVKATGRGVRPCRRSCSCSGRLLTWSRLLG
ncbi:hypothetical protein ACFXJ8_22805 [Nonomuraea sp. NPDC059194]|uniref:hypothetical protein n=1 Tax=Nonomuraea sp. NPDC059194 TaxID=3346764 RepID=UPI0036963BD9